MYSTRINKNIIHVKHKDANILFVVHFIIF